MLLKLSYLFGLVVFGNLIDNISQPKKLVQFAQIALAMYWTFTGLYLRGAGERLGEELKNYLKLTNSNYFNDLNAAQIISAGVNIGSIL